MQATTGWAGAGWRCEEVAGVRETFACRHEFFEWQIVQALNRRPLRASLQQPPPQEAAPSFIVTDPFHDEQFMDTEAIEYSRVKMPEPGAVSVHRPLVGTP